MSLSKIIGGLNFTLNIPGELIANGKVVGENVSISYASDRLKLKLIPIDHNGNRGQVLNFVNQIMYNRGTLTVIGRETTLNVNYSAIYSLMKQRLQITVNNRQSEIKVKSLTEVIGTIAKLVVSSVPRGKF